MLKFIIVKNQKKIMKNMNFSNFDRSRINSLFSNLSSQNLYELNFNERLQKLIIYIGD